MARLLPLAVASTVLLLAPLATQADPTPRTTTGPFGSRADLDLEYGRAGTISLRLDLYRPPPTTERPYPVVVFVHGGGWIGGAKSPCPCVNLTTRGFAVASVEYRLATVAPFPAQIEDVKAAVRWVRANAGRYGMDAHRVGAMGTSAGGHLVALLGTSGGVKALEGDAGNPKESSRVCAVCDWFGPTDLLQWEGHGSFISAMDPQSLIARLLGGTVAEKREVAVMANPITYVTPDDPPFLILHGDRDNVVPLHQSRILDEALAKAGVETHLYVQKGGGHGFADPVATALALDFLETHVKRFKEPGPSSKPLPETAKPPGTPVAPLPPGAPSPEPSPASPSMDGAR